MDTDFNYKSYVGEKDLVIDSWHNPDQPSAYDDIAKFSHCDNTSLEGTPDNRLTINGGSEDCIDAVRGNKYSFKHLLLIPFNNGITLKGSIDGYYLKDILFYRAGNEYTIELGQYDNYWYIGRPPTRNGKIENVKVLGDLPFKIRVWNADVPELIDCPGAKIVKIPVFIWFPYFCFQGTVRFFTNLFKKNK